MDLWATALALADSTAKAVILDIDIQILTNERADQIRAAVSHATQLPVQNIRVSATHTHSGPVPYKSWIEKGYEMVDPWFQNLGGWCAEAAQSALTDLQPVDVRLGRGSSRINANRRCVTPTGERYLGVNPEGVSDHEVLVITLDSSRAPVATLVNFACHGTVMGPVNRLITPDYPGALKRVVEIGAGGKCLFLLGSAGDQGPVQGFQSDTKVYRDLGAALGHEVNKVVFELRSVPTKTNFQKIIPSGAPLGDYQPEFLSERSLPLQILEKEIPVQLREGLPEKTEAAQKLDLWKTRLKAAREKNDPAAITESIYMARRADIQLRMAEDFGGKSSTGVRTHFLCFGEVAIVGCNIEPFCEIGLAIKRQSPFAATLVCGYTNGRMAYMPTAEEWPKGGYEVENSPFGQSAASTLQNEIIATLNQMHTTRAKQSF